MQRSVPKRKADAGHSSTDPSQLTTGTADAPQLGNPPGVQVNVGTFNVGITQSMFLDDWHGRALKRRQTKTLQGLPKSARERL